MRYCRPSPVKVITRHRPALDERHRPALDADLQADRSAQSSRRWTAWGRRHGCATCRRPSGAFSSGTPPARCVLRACELHDPVHTSNTRPPSSLAARGRNSLAGQWQPTSSSTRRPRRHPHLGNALMRSTGSRQSAAGPSPSCRLKPMADHDRLSDRWVAALGSCRRLPSDRLWT